MEAPPDDVGARREWLKRWVTEHELRILQAEAERQRIIKRSARLLRRSARLRWRTMPMELRDRWRTMPGNLAGASERLAGRVLDRGLNTSGKVHQPEHSHPERVRYVPSPWYVLPRELRYLGVSDRDTFVDFGCGKGRVVHQAARRPFRRVIGVEVSPVLAEMARTGLAARKHQHRCRNVEIVVADAAEFRVPDDVTIGYFYHPFRGETLTAVLRGIIDSIDRNPRCVRLIYLDPPFEAVLDTGRFRLLKERRGLLRDNRFHRVAIYESC
jgi:SAM-dependent methyltransferase